jgi:hypothetical protein
MGPLLFLGEVSIISYQKHEPSMLVVLILFMVVPDWQDNMKLVIKSARNNFIQREVLENLC